MVRVRDVYLPFSAINSYLHRLPLHLHHLPTLHGVSDHGPFPSEVPG